MSKIAVSAKLFSSVFAKAFNKEIDWDSDSIKVMLTDASSAPDQDTWDYKNDVTNEIIGIGYFAGGASIGSPSVSYNSTTNTLTFDGADVSWTSATFTCRYAIIYDSTPGSDSARPLIAYVDFGENISVTAGTFQITWAATGIATVTVA